MVGMVSEAISVFSVSLFREQFYGIQMITFLANSGSVENTSAVLGVSHFRKTMVEPF